MTAPARREMERGNTMTPITEHEAGTAAAVEEHPHGHPPYLQHHFDTPQQQFESGKLGMWIFLATEVLFFGGLFVAYAVYRNHHPEIFLYAHQYLDKTLGGINTVVLICSSFTMAWAVRCAQLGKQRGLIALLSLTLLCAFGFLGIKYVEYEQKWKHGLLMGYYYNPQEHEAPHAESAPPAHSEPETPPTASQPAFPDPGQDASVEERSTIPPAAVGPSGLASENANGGHANNRKPANVHIFFGIYFAMTGLHGIHVLGGIAVIAWLLYRSVQGHFNADYFTPVDLVGLYWHLVDLIWIYLFPLLYLIH